MKSIRIVALGAALAAGTSLALTVAPAMAKKEEAKPADSGPKAKPSKAFIAAAQPLQKALMAKDYVAAAPLLEAAKAVATTPDDKYFLGTFQINLGAGTNDQALMESGMASVIESGFANAEEKMKYNGNLGVYAQQREDYPTALKYYEAARAAGNTAILVNIVGVYAGMKQYDKSLDAMDVAMAAKKAAGEVVPEDWYKRANGVAIESGNAALISRALGSWVSAYPTADNWRAVTVRYREEANLNSSALVDLYRLMRQIGALKGERDYVEYADELFKGAQYGESQSVLEEGFSNGQIPATSVAGKELRGLVAGRINSDRASLPNEAKSVGSADARIATKIGNAFLSYGNYSEALRVYNVALAKPGADADEINTKIGIVNVMTGNFADAKASFKKVTTSPRSGVASLWLLWLKQKAAPAS